MQEKIIKYKWLLIGIAVFMIAGYLIFYYYYLPYKKVESKCLEYVLYDPEKQAYHWKAKFLNEWYKTHKDAMTACINVLKEIFKQ